VNQWFPTMMKTKITYSVKDKAKSIYDYFSDPELFETQLTYSRRHFKRDSFYHYSQPVKLNDRKSKIRICASTGKEWIKEFSRLNLGDEYSYWLEPRDSKEGYTGYNEKLKEQEYLFISKKEIEELGDLIPDKCKTNINYRSDKYNECRIRLFKLSDKIFPIGLKAFRVSYCQYAVQYPPLTSKFLWEEYTREFIGKENFELGYLEEPHILVWDPSSGWGGRLLGALSVKADRKIFYLGTDPNKEHITDYHSVTGEPIFSKYDSFAAFYNNKTNRGNCLFPELNTWRVLHCGSEVLKDTQWFEKCKGKTSVVFTSPPYFNKEVYSGDEEQSCNKFSNYNDWRDGFLKTTLETAYLMLRDGGYLIWNIADIKLGKDFLPLEEDSCKIIEELGFEYVKTWKMAFVSMPGGNRIDPNDGAPTAKNFCKVNGIWLKYEPIFVYKKV